MREVGPDWRLVAGPRLEHAVPLAVGRAIRLVQSIGQQRQQRHTARHEQHLAQPVRQIHMPGARGIGPPDCVGQSRKSDRQVCVYVGQVGRVQRADRQAAYEQREQVDASAADYAQCPRHSQECQGHGQHVSVQVAVQECEQRKLGDLISWTRRNHPARIPVPIAAHKRKSLDPGTGGPRPGRAR